MTLGARNRAVRGVCHAQWRHVGKHGGRGLLFALATRLLPSRTGARLACRRATRAQYAYGFALEQAGWGVVAAFGVADSGAGQQVSESVPRSLGRSARNHW